MRIPVKASTLPGPAMIGLALLVGCADRESGEATTDPNARAAQLARDADERDNSIWAAEVEAQRHEAVIVDLWDRLRAARTSDPFIQLRDFPFARMRVGKLGTPRKIENGVFVTEITPAAGEPQYLDRDGWSDVLLKVKGRGFQIAQSEWHHSRFEPSGNGTPARSEVAFEVHLQKKEPAHALVVRGILGVEWKRPGPSDTPEVERIDASQVTLVEREGRPGFERALNIAPEPESPGGSVELAPVMVYDLDRDGLPEILLGGINVLLRNRGDFRFDRERIFADRTILQQAGNLADFNGDGWIDLLGVTTGGEGVLLAGESKGTFGSPKKPWDFTLTHPSAMTCGDVDGDGDLDVWLAQYRAPYLRGQMPTPFYDANDGHPSYLLLNNGTGTFSDSTGTAGLAEKRHRRTYSASLVDLDDDHDLDLMVVSDFSGLDIYTNDGAGKFSEATDQFVDESHAFGMSHTFGDFDLDGKPDLYMAGMSSTTARRLQRLGLGRADFPEYTEMRDPMTYGNRLYQRRGDRYVQTALNDNAARAGWTWGCAAADFDNDGDDDLYVANGHISGKTATDYCTRYWCHDLYTGDSRERPEIARLLSDAFRPPGLRGLNTGGISWNGYEKNRLFMNLGGKGFLDVGFHMGAGFEEDCRGVVAADLDADGKQDLVVVAHGWQPGKAIVPKQSLFLLRNRLPDSGNRWIGFHLRGERPGAAPAGARVTLKTSRGERSQAYVTGDSFYAQRPATAHFGLGEGETVERVIITWPDQQHTVLTQPAPGSYHAVSPGDQE